MPKPYCNLCKEGVKHDAEDHASSIEDNMCSCGRFAILSRSVGYCATCIIEDGGAPDDPDFDRYAVAEWRKEQS